MSHRAGTIKSMKLYQHVERVERELAARGLDGSATLDVEALESLDQLHYHGRSAVLDAIDWLELGPEARVLDIGSGLGGPARVIASEVGCRVTAVELQDDLHRLAESLTRRCGLADRIEHRRADVLTASLPASDYDAVVSWLTFLHIPERETLLSRCLRRLRPGGKILVEDFFARRALSDEARELLANEVYCQRLDSLDDYRGLIEEAGFADVECHDMTNSWTQFVGGRLKAFLDDEARFSEVHGEGAFQALATFYRVMDQLFSSGELGGLRWTARRPAD
jgi:cyclopropane fatty-acyl-phospholipid synthase-like methyltransferase